MINAGYTIQTLGVLFGNVLKQTVAARYDYVATSLWRRGQQIDQTLYTVFTRPADGMLVDVQPAIPGVGFPFRFVRPRSPDSHTIKAHQ